MRPQLIGWLGSGCEFSVDRMLQSKCQMSSSSKCMGEKWVFTQTLTWQHVPCRTTSRMGVDVDYHLITGTIPSRQEAGRVIVISIATAKLPDSVSVQAREWVSRQFYLNLKLCNGAGDSKNALSMGRTLHEHCGHIQILEASHGHVHQVLGPREEGIGLAGASATSHRSGTGDVDLEQMFCRLLHAARLGVVHMLLLLHKQRENKCWKQNLLHGHNRWQRFHNKS